MNRRLSTCIRCGVELSATSTHSLCPGCALFPETVAYQPEVTNGALLPPVAPLSALDALPIGDGPARLQLGDEIARGSMGIVFKGRDPDLGRELAVKLLLEQHRDDAELVRRFVTQARIAGGLQHPGIVPIYELGVFEDARPYFTMKLVEGRTFEELLRARRSVDDDLGRHVTIFEGVCRAVAYAHARGVVHRDLKPAYIIVGGFGEVQLMGWGLSQVLTNSDADRRSDIAALGSILCAILTGKPELARLESSSADAELIALARQCLAAERETGPVDAAEVADRVTAYRAAVQEKLLAADAARAAEAARAVEAERTAMAAEGAAAAARRSRKLIGVLGLCFLGFLVLGGAGHMWFQGRQNMLRTRTANAVLDALAMAARHAGEADSRSTEALAKCDEALAAVSRAEQLLKEGVPDPELRGRVAAARARIGEQRGRALAESRRLETERSLLARIEQIRGGRGARRDPARTDAEYAGAFLAAGIDIDRTDSALAGAWVKRRSDPAEVVVALDDWASVRRRARGAGPAWRRVVDAARSGDPHDWRDDLRARIARGDRHSLRTLDDDEAQTGAGLMLLSFEVDDDDRSAVIDMLMRAWKRSASDFWINYDLGTLIGAAGRSGLDPIPYLRAAVAIRPRSSMAHERLGAALEARGRREEADAEFQEAARLARRTR
jgi:serine/threonine-protein kinase